MWLMQPGRLKYAIPGRISLPQTGLYSQELYFHALVESSKTTIPGNSKGNAGSSRMPCFLDSRIG
jgi:hypothetical protein